VIRKLQAEFDRLEGYCERGTDKREEKVAASIEFANELINILWEADHDGMEDAIFHHLQALAQKKIAVSTTSINLGNYLEALRGGGFSGSTAVESTEQKFNKIFDGQLGTLSFTGSVSLGDIEILQSKRQRVWEKIKELVKQSKTQPFNFFPVIPQKSLPFATALNFLEKFDESVVVDENNVLSDGLSEDLVEVPNEPYYVIGVEDGELTLGDKVEEVAKLCVLREVSALTIGEGLALCLHSDVLQRHGILMAGSRWMDEPEGIKWVMGIYLEEGVIKAGPCTVRSSHEEIGTPFCECRL